MRQFALLTMGFLIAVLGTGCGEKTTADLSEKGDVSALTKQMSNTTWSATRRDTAIALGKAASNTKSSKKVAEAIKTLTETLEDHSWEVRVEAARSLAQIGQAVDDPGVVKQIIQTLTDTLDDKSDRVGMLTALELFALGTANGDETARRASIQKLVAVKNNSSDPYVPAAAAERLEKLDAPELKAEFE